MESVAIATTSRSLPLPFPCPTSLHRHHHRASLLPIAASKYRDADGEQVWNGNGNGSRSVGGDLDGHEPTGLAPYMLSVSPFSKDAAMGLVLNAATGSGWMTGSGMEGPPAASEASGADRLDVSTLPWSLFTESPQRRMWVAFTCNLCGQRTTRAI